MNLPAPVYSMAYEPRKLAATEQRINDVYEAAKMGLSGDSLALAANMSPAEYRRLCEFDDAVAMAAMKGKADAEKELASTLFTAAQNGDTKAALEILKHKHDWVAKQQVNVEIDQRISITDALREANGRIIDAGFEVVDTKPTPSHTTQSQFLSSDRRASVPTLGLISFGQSVNQAM